MIFMKFPLKSCLSLGGFLEGSRHVLAESRQDLGETNSGRNLGFLRPDLVRKASKMMPDGSQGRVKSIKNQGFSWHGFRKAKNRVARFTSACFWLHFGSILGAKFGDFSCYLLASFFDWFVEASGSIFRAILDDFGRSFWILFQTLRKKAHPTNSL